MLWLTLQHKWCKIILFTTYVVYKGVNIMKQTLERLWNDYLADECAAIDTDEERALTRRTVELHEAVNALLNKEQAEAVEKYVDVLCDVEAFFVKKAFLKGCEFATSFLLETACRAYRAK